MYTVWAAVAVAGVVAIELVWARTGIFRRPAYWVTITITWAFQIPVDGWLTKLSAPIVRYNPHELSGVRFPWDIPIEDFAYGFALVTFALVLWLRFDPSRPAAVRPGRRASTSGRAGGAFAGRSGPGGRERQAPGSGPTDWGEDRVATPRRRTGSAAGEGTDKGLVN